MAAALALAPPTQRPAHHYIRTIHTTFTSTHPSPSWARPQNNHAAALQNLNVALNLSVAQIPQNYNHHQPKQYIPTGARKRAYAFRAPVHPLSKPQRPQHPGQTIHLHTAPSPRPRLATPPPPPTPYKFDPFADEPQTQTPSSRVAEETQTHRLAQASLANWKAPEQDIWKSGLPVQPPRRSPPPRGASPSPPPRHQGRAPSRSPPPRQQQQQQTFTPVLPRVRASTPVPEPSFVQPQRPTLVRSASSPNLRTPPPAAQPMQTQMRAPSPPQPQPQPPQIRPIQHANPRAARDARAKIVAAMILNRAYAFGKPRAATRRAGPMGSRCSSYVPSGLRSVVACAEA